DTTYTSKSTHPNSTDYVTARILGLPWTVALSKGGSQVRLTTFGYDESGLTLYSAIAEHTPGAGRPGNLTSRTESVYNPVTLTTGNLVWTANYDVAGNMVNTCGPTGDCVAYAYDDSQSVNAYSMPTCLERFKTLTTVRACSRTASGDSLSESWTYDYSL